MDKGTLSHNTELLCVCLHQWKGSVLMNKPTLNLVCNSFFFLSVFISAWITSLSKGSLNSLIKNFYRLVPLFLDLIYINVTTQLIYRELGLKFNRLVLRAVTLSRCLGLQSSLWSCFKLTADLCWWTIIHFAFLCLHRSAEHNAPVRTAVSSLCFSFLLICLCVVLCSVFVLVFSIDITSVSVAQNDLKWVSLQEKDICAHMLLFVLFFCFFFYILVTGCTDPNPGNLSITTTTVSLVTGSNCPLSTGNNNSTDSISNLTPGAIYPIIFGCFTCCKEVTTSKSVYFV